MGLAKRDDLQLVKDFNSGAGDLPDLLRRLADLGCPAPDLVALTAAMSRPSKAPFQVATRSAADGDRAEALQMATESLVTVERALADLAARQKALEGARDAIAAARARLAKR